MIEDLTKINYRAPSETLGSSRRLKGSGVIEMNRMTAIEAKLDALMNKLRNQDRRMHSTHKLGTVEGNEQNSSADEGLAHESPYQVKEAQFVNGNPFEILKRVGTVACWLAPPSSLLGVHEVFHISMLRKYTPDPTHVVDLGEITIDIDGTLKEGPACILDSRD